MREVIDRIQYIGKNRFWNWSAVRDLNIPSLKNTRFSHHLSKNLGTLHTMSKAAAYLVGGVSMIITGVEQVQEPNNNSNKIVGEVAVGVGTLLVLTPFISAYQMSAGELP